MQILNEYVYYYSDWHIGLSVWSLLGVLLILFSICIFIIGAKSNLNESAVCFFVSLFFIFGVLLIVCRNTKTSVTRYEVLINEPVSFKEFNNRYKLIEQCGDIYVIEEKNNDCPA